MTAFQFVVVLLLFLGDVLLLCIHVGIVDLNIKGNNVEGYLKDIYDCLLDYYEWSPVDEDDDEHDGDKCGGGPVGVCPV